MFHVKEPADCVAQNAAFVLLKISAPIHYSQGKLE